MNIDLSKWGPATVLVVALVVIVAGAGAVVTVVNPDALPFETYLKTLTAAAGGAGLLGVGRGIHLAGAASPAAAPEGPAEATDVDEDDDLPADGLLPAATSVPVTAAPPPDTGDSRSAIAKTVAKGAVA